MVHLKNWAYTGLPICLVNVLSFAGSVDLVQKVCGLLSIVAKVVFFKTQDSVKTTVKNKEFLFRICFTFQRNVKLPGWYSCIFYCSVIEDKKSNFPFAIIVS